MRSEQPASLLVSVLHLTIKVKEAEDGDKLEKGQIYVAPGGKHMEVVKNPDGSHKIKLNTMPAIGGLRPCANITYDSLSKSGYDEVVCVVLTGMGADGTNGILSLGHHNPVCFPALLSAACSRCRESSFLCHVSSVTLVTSLDHST